QHVLPKSAKWCTRNLLSRISSVESRMAERAFTSKEILSQLDSFADRGGVPFFDNGQCYPIECRLMIYCGKEHWGITLEEVHFSPGAGGERKGGHLGVRTNIYSYGNGLRVKVGGNNLYGFNF